MIDSICKVCEGDGILTDTGECLACSVAETCGLCGCVCTAGKVVCLSCRAKGKKNHVVRLSRIAWTGVGRVEFAAIIPLRGIISISKGDSLLGIYPEQLDDFIEFLEMVKEKAS